jgi:pyrimidine deaminase RibD-like protein
VSLDRAFALARRVDPRAVSPNPRVGCIIMKNGQVIVRKNTEDSQWLW